MGVYSKKCVEIGGFLELEEYKGEEYYSNLIALNTARNALLYVIKTKKIEKLYIPTYICSAIIGVLERAQIKYVFYGIGRDFLPNFSGQIGENEAIYIVNYYGMLNCDNIKQLKSEYGNIIVDNAHAFFAKPIEGIDTIYSCRKFFGVSDGAYLSTDRFIDENLETDVSYERMFHILGRYEKSAHEFYKEFRKVEESFDELPLMFMSKLTTNMMRKIDYLECRTKRTNNFISYNEGLKDINLLKIRNIEGAYTYPLYLENAQELREKMIRERIYISLLWPNVTSGIDENDMALEYSKNILPLPCDQRMNAEDIERIIKFILSEYR